MDRMNEQWNIPEGVEVFGAEGDKVGKIVAVHPSYVVVEKGFFFPTDYYIPRTAIANFDGENAYLAVSKDQALNQEWSEAPIDDFSAGPEGAATGGAYAAETTAGTTEADLSGKQHRTGGTVEHADTGDTLRVPVYEEELVATKRPRVDETGQADRAADELSARETSASEEPPPA